MSPTQIEAAAAEILDLIGTSPIPPSEIAAIIAKHAGGSGVDGKKVKLRTKLFELNGEPTLSGSHSDFYHDAMAAHKHLSQHADQPSK